MSTWKLVYNRFDPAEESLRESLCTLGNGHFGVRGSAPEEVASRIHYPGTYIAGVYNKLATHIAGRTVYNEDLVNCPNWTFLTFRIGSGEWFSLSRTRILSFSQTLDMHKSVLSRRVRFQDKQGRRTLIESFRIVHMGDPNCGAFKYIITPENYNEYITVRTMLDGTVLNTGVERYRQLEHKHLVPLSLGGFSRNGVYLHMKTSKSRIEIAEASKVRIFVGGKELRPVMKILMKGKERIGQQFRFFACEKQKYEIEKIVSVYTSRSQGISNIREAAIASLNRVQRFDVLMLSHQKIWAHLWSKYDIKIEGDPFHQMVLRLHIFHLLQTASIHNPKIDAGFPARGLHGEAYRGHVFWDELFAMPFYDLHVPGITKALLLYRFRRLHKARDYARKNGYGGAMFPWQSGSTGEEETQVLHLNPLSGKWGPDYSRLQRHVSFAIAYNTWRYCTRNSDYDFFIRFGAELLLSIARFGASLARYSAKDKRFHTRGIMGPDEFHEKFPGSRRPGLNDNAYTNVMVVWTIMKALEVLGMLPEYHRSRIMRKLKIDQKELKRWNNITRRMYLCINENNIISQYDGYFKLKELDWEGYLAEYGNIQRMDRILKAEGRAPDEYKVSKQADVLMLFYLLSLDEIKELFHQLGYPFDKKMLRKNYEYYLKRTSHGSTLSKVVHCFVALHLRKPKDYWQLFKEVMESDLYDTQGGTTQEGIHAGVMGGSVDLVVRGFAGVHIFPDHIRINPRLPARWKGIKLKFMYKQRVVSFALNKAFLHISIQGPKGETTPIPVEINGRTFHFHSARSYKIAVKKKT